MPEAASAASAASNAANFSASLSTTWTGVGQSEAACRTRCATWPTVGITHTSPGTSPASRSTVFLNGGRMKRISFRRLPGSTARSGASLRDTETAAEIVASRDQSRPLEHRDSRRSAPSARSSRRTAPRKAAASAPHRSSAPWRARGRRATPTPAAAHSSRCVIVGSIRFSRRAMRWVKSGESISTTRSGRTLSAKSDASRTRRRIVGMRGTTSRRPITAVASSGNRLSKPLRRPSQVHRRRRSARGRRQGLQPCHQLGAELIS